MDEKTVQDFWQNHACGDALVGGLRDRFGGDYEKFFSDYDKFRYAMESHIPACLDALGGCLRSGWARARTPRA
jgi:hypothetical protein